jgi:P pilus assembly chaperone PapD
MVMLMPAHAQAAFIISSAILEFTQDGPRHQDVEVISQSDKNDYVVAEVSEILQPGLASETRRVITDVSQSGLLVSPDKMVLAGKNRKVMRFVLLKEPDDQEHIYRVAIKPVINQTGSSDKVGLKVLIGYEVLVIVRPRSIASSYTAERQGNVIKVANNGNTNILFEGGQQCATPSDCKQTPVLRVYPGQTDSIKLGGDGVVHYSVWDGKDTSEKQF